MTREDALAKLISARHHCFARGVAGRAPQGDFRAAFRTLNSLYVLCRAEKPGKALPRTKSASKADSEPSKPPASATKIPAAPLLW